MKKTNKDLIAILVVLFSLVMTYEFFISMSLLWSSATVAEVFENFDIEDPTTRLYVHYFWQTTGLYIGVVCMVIYLGGNIKKPVKSIVLPLISMLAFFSYIYEYTTNSISGLDIGTYLFERIFIFLNVAIFLWMASMILFRTLSYQQSAKVNAILVIVGVIWMTVVLIISMANEYSYNPNGLHLLGTLYFRNETLYNGLTALLNLVLIIPPLAFVRIARGRASE